jgi:hypothetical protein
MEVGNESNSLVFFTLNRTAEDNENDVSIGDTFKNEECLKKLDPTFFEKNFPKLRGKKDLLA